MKKNIITDKITPCCGLPFSVTYWWVSNLLLKSENDRKFVLSQIKQNGSISMDGWETLINSGTLEFDANLTKSKFLAWFNCGRNPTCEQLKTIIESYKVGFLPTNDSPINTATIDGYFQGLRLEGTTYTKEQINALIDSDSVPLGNITPTTTFQNNVSSWGFAQAGLYPNIGGLLVEENTFAIVTKKENGSFESTIIELPDNSSKTQQWEQDVANLGVYKVGSIVYNNGVNYRVKNGVSSTMEEPSAISNDWEAYSFLEDFKKNAFSISGYVSKIDGNVVFDNEFSSSTFLKIKDFGNLVVTGYSGATDNASFVSFYDEKLNFIKSYNTNVSGWVTRVNVPENEIPLKTKYVKVTRHKNQEAFVLGVEYLLNANYWSEFIQAKNENNLQKYIDNENGFFSIRGFINKNNGLLISDDSFFSTRFLKLDNTKDIIVNGYSGKNDNASLISFYDKDFNFISSYNANIAGTIENHTIPKNLFPQNAIYIKATASNLHTTRNVQNVIKNLTANDLFNYDNYLQKKIENIKYVDKNEGYFSIKGYVNKNNGLLISTDSFFSTRFLKLDNTKDIIVNGYSGKNDNASLISFYDKDFNFISSYNANIAGTIENHTIPKNLFPQNAIYIKATASNLHTTRNVQNVDISVTANDLFNYDMYLEKRIETRYTKATLPFEDTVVIENYLGNYENIHPKVLYFPQGLWGFKFWMAYTPFPHEWDKDENPCIAVSSDGYNWTIPSGHENPLAFAPQNGYNSDTHLVFRSDTQTLECWYRPFDTPTLTAKLMRRTTVNGFEWTPAEEIQGITGVLSPSIIFEDGRYKIWYPNATKTIYSVFSELGNPTGWSTPVAKELNIYAWHMDVIRSEKGLEFFIQGWEEGKGSNFESDFFYLVEDGIADNNAVKVLDKHNLPAYRDGLYFGLYRGSIVKVGDVYWVFYTYRRTDGYQGMILGQTKDIYRILPYNRSIETESNNVVIEENGTISELYVHSAKTIFVKNCDVVIESFTGCEPNSLIKIVISNGSCTLQNSDRIDKTISKNDGIINIIPVSSREVIVVE